MNKKMLKILASFTCMVGFTSIISSFSTSCGAQPTVSSLVIEKPIENMHGETKTDIKDSPDLSQEIKTNLGQSVTLENDLKFTIEPKLPDGLFIGERTGIIDGTPTAESEAIYKIKATATINGKKIYGYSNEFKITIVKNYADFSIDYSEDETNISAWADDSGYLSGKITNDYAGSDEIVYSIINSPLKDDEKIAVEPDGDIFYRNLSKGTYRLTIKAQLKNNPDATASINLTINVIYHDWNVFITYDQQETYSNWLNWKKTGLDASKFSYRYNTINNATAKIEFSIVNANTDATKCSVAWNNTLKTVTWDATKLQGGEQLIFGVQIKVTNSANTATDVVSFDLSIFNNILPSNVFSTESAGTEKVNITGFSVNFSDSKIYDQYKNCDTLLIPNKIKVNGVDCEVISVKDNCFYNENFGETTIPDFIKNASFANPESGITVGSNSFRASSVQSVYISKKVTAIGRYAFAECNLENVEVENGNTKYAIAENIGDWRHSSQYNGKMIINISTSAEDSTESKYFNGTNCVGCLVAGYIYFGANITKIDNDCFDYCYGIKGLHFTSLIDTIGICSFADCVNLNEIIFEDIEKMPSLGGSAFLNVANTGKVDLIYNYQEKLTKEEVLESLKVNTELPEGWQVKDDVIPYDKENDEERGFFNFQLNSSGTEYSVSISDYAKENPNEWMQYDILEIPTVFKDKPVTSIGTWGFVKGGGCGALTSALPSSIKHLKFTNDSQIKEIGAHAFDSVFTYELSLPSSLTKMDTSAFMHSSGYNILDLTNCKNLSSISTHCFESTDIKELYLPASVQLEEDAFNYCSNLCKIVWNDLRSNPLIITNNPVFLGCASNGVVISKNNVDYSSEKLKEYLIGKGNTSLENWETSI